MRILLITIFLTSSIANAESYLTGYQITPSTTKLVYSANGTWYKVTHSGASTNYFIPTKTTAEWNVFD